MSYINYELVKQDSIPDNITSDELFERNINIIRSQDISFINFVNLYRVLCNLRLKYAGMDIVLSSTEFWPSINSGKTAIREYLNGQKKKKYKEVEKYIFEVFKPALDEQLRVQKLKYRKLEGKLKTSQMLTIRHSHHREIYAFSKHPSDNIEHNGLIFLLKC